VVSITVVVLTLAANQLGPRLVTSFMADRQIKIVLGLFIGTILYLLTVLRSLDGRQAADDVPHLAVTMGSALSVGCLFALLFYIHKIARSIIADTVVQDMAQALRRSVEANLPDGDEVGHGLEAAVDVAWPSRWVALGRTGYVQIIDHHALVALAEKAEVVIRLDVRAGHFVLEQGRHAAVLAPEPPDLDEAIRRAFVIAGERSPAQDIEYAIRRLVEIALRALSPGINDPFTAIAVVDQLGGALGEMLGRPLPQAIYRDQHGQPRLLANVTDTGGLLGAAFSQIRQAAQAHAAVLIELADILGKLAPLTCRPAQRKELLRHVEMVERAGRRHLDEPGDAADLMRRVSWAKDALRPSETGG